MHLDVPWTYPCSLNVRRSGCLLFPHFALLSPSACCLLHLPPCLFASGLDCWWVQVSWRQWRTWRTSTGSSLSWQRWRPRRSLLVLCLAKRRHSNCNKLIAAICCYNLRSASCGQLWAAMSIQHWIALCAGMRFMEAFLETADGFGRLRKLSWKEDGDDDEDSDEVSPPRHSNSFILACFS